MFDADKFKKVVREKGLTLQEVADYLKIDKSTLYRKMNGGSDFYRSEMQLLCNLLSLKDPTEIFSA